MEINGLPAHALMVHAAVMFIPLSATVALVYAGVPRWRWSLRWPMVGVTVIALGVTIATYFSGRNLRDRFEEKSIDRPGIALHAERADVLIWLVIVFAVVVLLAAWGLGGASGLVSGRFGRDRHNPLVEWSIVAMTVMMALSVIAMTIATGDAGSNSVWRDKGL